MSTLKAPEELTLQDLLALTEAEEGEEEHGEETHEEEEVPNPVLPTGNEIIWAAVFFFALWVLMRYVLLPPIQRITTRRGSRADPAATESSECIPRRVISSRLSMSISTPCSRSCSMP